MAKEEEFAMIEEFCENCSVLISLLDVKRIFNIKSANYSPKGDFINWNKNEFKAFIDELLVLHSKMK